MRHYQSSLLLARVFPFQCVQLRSSQCNVDVALLPNCMHVGHSLSLRQYSGGFFGLNKMPSSFNNIRSEDGVKNSDTIEDYRQLGNSIERSGVDYKQNVEHFQQWSNPDNHNPVNGGSNVQYNSQDYAQKAAQQNPYYSGSRNAAGSQRANSYWTSNSDTIEDYRQLGNSIERSGADYKQNVEHFQQRSDPQNHNPVNGGLNAQYNSQDYAQKAAQQNPGYSGSRNAMGSQQFNSYRTSNPDTIEDYRQLSNSIERSGADYKQNVEHFQQHSNPQNYNPVNGGSNAQYNSQDYVQKVAQQNPGYSGSRNATGSQQVNSYWTSNSGPSQPYSSNSFIVNAVAHHPSGYQQEHAGVQSSLNADPPTDKMVVSSGYYNTPLGPQQQHSNVSPNANLHHQQLLIATTNGSSGENVITEDEVIEGTLQELDVACKQWDLVRAVECMTYLGTRGVGIDLPRYLVLIEACGEAKASVEAKAVHDHLNFFSPVSTSLFDKILDMYGKCGLMSDAYDTFNSMPERSLSTWVNMINWYAKNGLGEEAIDMFTKFKEAGLKPDGEIFSGLFDACGVVGDVTEGMLHFDSMSKIYGIAPTMDHYASIVRMFGSAGHLDGALEFIEKMPMEPNIDVWESLMNVSRIQGNVELGDRCAQIVELLDPSRLTKESKAGLLPVKNSGTRKKKVRKASLSEHGQHQYKAGDRSHPEQAKIYALLSGFKESMKEAGYVPETRFVLHDITQEEKEDAIMTHSERLACAYNLLTSSPRASMRIIKNLRVCGDCHNVFKIISKLVGREVVMRDQKRFHHFSHGKCSCNDYW